MKKGLIIAAAVLTFVGLAMIAGAIAAVGFDPQRLDTAAYETNTYAPEEEFRAIEIRTREADVILKKSEDGRCSVACVERDKDRHTVTVENGILKIGEEDERGWIDHLTIFSKPLSVTVSLPADRYESLLIESGTGDVEIPASFGFGQIGVRTSTGDVVCLASADGKLAIWTNTGEIRLEGGSRATEAELSVSTGRITVTSFACGGELSVSVGTGKTKLTDVTCGALVSKGSTGDITLRNVTASGSFLLTRSTGDVRFEDCDAEEISVRTSTGDVTGTLRSAKTFTVTTSTGSVRVPESSNGGKCEIRTSTGDVKITLTEG